MAPGALRWIDTRYWPESKLNGFRHLLIEEGDIILAMDRPLVSAGLKIARAKPSDLPCLLVQRMARFRLMNANTGGFLYCSLQTHRFVLHLLGDQTGTQVPHISGSGIGSFVTPLAPLREQLVIQEEVERRLSIVDELEAQVGADLKRAGRLRQSILKRAFAGRLVPQDPTDEPAAKLLERISEGRSNDTTTSTDGLPARTRGNIGGRQREFTNGHARAGGNVHVPPVLDDPAAHAELAVDLAPGFLFGGHRKAAICKLVNAQHTAKPQR